MKEIDFQFGIKSRSFRIAYHLNESVFPQLSGHDFYEKLEYDVKTFPFYNGREKSICITISPFREKNFNYNFWRT